MNFWKMLVAICLAAVASAVPARGQTPPGKRADIENLLEITGSLKLGQQVAQAMSTRMVQVIGSSHPELSKKVLDVIPEEINASIAAHAGSLKEPFVALYDKYYTADEIKQLLAFYSTDVGKKMISILPSLMQDSMAVGAEWGKSLGPDIERRIKARFKEQNVEL